MIRWSSRSRATSAAQAMIWLVVATALLLVEVAESVTAFRRQAARLLREWGVRLERQERRDARRAGITFVASQVDRRWK